MWKTYNVLKNQQASVNAKKLFLNSARFFAQIKRRFAMNKMQLIQGMSSLKMDPSLCGLADKYANRVWSTYSLDGLWFERDFKKGPDYRPGPVTVIKFDYLNQQ